MDTNVLYLAGIGLVAFAIPWMSWAYIIHVRASTAVFGEEKK